MDNESHSDLFMQHGVTLKKTSASYLSALNTVGVLSFCKYQDRNVHFFEWKQTEMCEILDTESQDSGWSLVDTIESTSSSPLPTPSDGSKPLETAGGGSPTAAAASAEGHHSRSSPKISFRVLLRDLKGVEFGKNELRLFSEDYSIHSMYLFNHGSPHSFVEYLERNRFIRKSSRRKQFFHCLKEEDTERLQRSFSELNIEDIRKRPRATNPYIDFMSRLATVHQQILPLGRTVEESRSPQSPQREGGDNTAVNGTITPEKREAPQEVSRLAPRPAVHRGRPLSAAQWAEFRAQDGSVVNVDRIKEIIFRGGIADDIRIEVWKYLLGLDIWEHTTAQRDERRGNKTQEYFQMKLQWLTITPVQEQNFSGYRERKCQIDKDVRRTDRTCEFYAGDDNPNLSKLQDILMTYAMYNFDLGYVQGMSDLLAPILSLVQNEADSFWCFVGFMQQVHTNFEVDQKGMKQQLDHLRTLVAFVNEKLYNYLKLQSSDNMYFCFRWLLVLFKREFTNSDIMQLWEVLWSGLPGPNFHLFMIIAILDQEMDVFINRGFNFNDILKHVNELSGNLNLEAILEQAESIYLQVKASLSTSKEPHTELREMIGEEIIPEGKVGGGAGTPSDDEEDSYTAIVNEKSLAEQEEMQRKVDEACDLSLSYAFF